MFFQYVNQHLFSVQKKMDKYTYKRIGNGNNKGGAYGLRQPKQVNFHSKKTMFPKDTFSSQEDSTKDEIIDNKPKVQTLDPNKQKIKQQIEDKGKNAPSHKFIPQSNKPINTNRSPSSVQPQKNHNHKYKPIECVQKRPLLLPAQYYPTNQQPKKDNLLQTPKLNDFSSRNHEKKLTESGGSLNSVGSINSIRSDGWGGIVNKIQKLPIPVGKEIEKIQEKPESIQQKKNKNHGQLRATQPPQQKPPMFPSEKKSHRAPTSYEKIASVQSHEQKIKKANNNQKISHGRNPSNVYNVKGNEKQISRTPNKLRSHQEQKKTIPNRRILTGKKESTPTKVDKKDKPCENKTLMHSKAERVVSTLTVPPPKLSSLKSSKIYTKKISLQPLSASPHCHFFSIIFSVMKTITQNEQTKVYLCHHEQTHSIYCLKEVKMNTQNFEQLIMESKVGNLVQHKSLTKCYAVLKNTEPDHQDKIYFLMEYAEGGNLRTFLNQSQAGKSTDERNRIHTYTSGTLPNPQQMDRKNVMSTCEAREVLQQLLEGVEYLHEHNIIHHDIKPQNILLTHLNTYKLSDYGSCIQKNKKQRYGTLDYVAPEIILNVNYTESIDMWSLGCLVYELVVGWPPFYHENPQETMRRIVSVEYDEKQITDEKLKSFIQNCLVGVGKNRLTVKEALSHQFLKPTSENSK